VAVALVEETSWPTPTVQEAGKIGNQPNHGQLALSNHPAIRGEVQREKYDKGKHGLPAPANPSADGNRQGLSEQSQRNWQTFAHGTHNRGETPHRQVVKALVNGEKAQTQCLTVDQVFAEEIKGTNPKSWATPNAFCYQPPENTEQWTKRAEYQQTEKGVNLHKPVQSQVLHENEKVMGSMPPSAGKLNPRWVETLMGLPIGWTMPSCTRPVIIAPMSFAVSGMGLSQPPQNEHLELF
jgi:hypothetical protein